MGGTTFSQYQPGLEVRAAFTEAHDLARYEHGNAGYTGSLAEKDSYNVITREPMSRSEADRLADRLINDSDPRIDDKWGPAGAIPVVNVAEGQSRTVKVTFDIPGGLDWQAAQRLIETQVGERVKLKAGERVISHNVQENVAGKARVTAQVPKEKAETRYIIPGTFHNRWETGFDTQAKARAAANTLANREQRLGEQDVQNFPIEGIFRRANGEALVTVTRTIPKRTLTVEATVVLPAKTTKTTPDGWLFFGWASC